MKVIKIKYVVFGLFAITFSLSSCSSDNDYDVKGNPDNLVYFKANANNTFNCSVIHTPVGDFGDVDAKFAVRMQRPASSNSTIIAEVDTSLIATYNKKNNTVYKVVPASLIDQSKMTATILKDSVKAQDSIEISIPESKLPLLTDSAYLIPVRITEVKGDGKGSEERGIGYVTISRETKLIQTKVNPENMPGSLLSDYLGWTAKFGDSSNSIDIKELFDNDITNGPGLNPTNGNTVIIDMQSVKNVIGIRLARWYYSYEWGGETYGYGYWFSAVHIWLSEDGNWNKSTDVGITSSNDMSSDANGFQYIALYGAIKSRYIKLQISSGDSEYSSLAELGVYTK